MLRIALINMPFASLQRPSLALTQLKSLTESEHAGRACCDVHYLNHDMAHYMGFEDYQSIESLEASSAGAGDWFFRQVAFPDTADNSFAYFKRYFSGRGPEIEALKWRLLDKRRGVEAFLEELIDRYDLASYAVVGFTSMFSQNVATFAMARLLKARNPAIVTLVGGANCETPMGQEIAKHVEAIDFVFSGPALASFPLFVGQLLAGDQEACHGIRGVLSRANQTGAKPTVPPLGEEVGLDKEVPLDYGPFIDLLAANFPDRGLEPFILFETSRGCWWGERAHCTFCGLNGGTMAFREMSPANALEQFRQLFSRYGERCNHFESVDNIMPRSYLQEVFPQLTPPPSASIFYEVKADLKDDELAVLARAQVNTLQPGIESLATPTLKLMRKGTTSFVNLRFLKGCARLAINPVWNVLVGFPREDEATYRGYVESFPRFHHLPPPSGVFPVRFDRFSPYFVQAKDYDLDLHAAEYFEYIYPFEPEVLDRLVYYFTDRNPSPSYRLATARWLDAMRERVRVWRDLWQGPAPQRPQLTVDPEDPQRVLDTRGEGPREHHLDELAARVLAVLDHPHNLAGLARSLPDVAAAEVAATLARLGELGLVFSEDGRAMSLVLASGEQAAAESRAA